VIDSGAEFQKKVDDAMVGNAKYRVLEFKVTFRQARAGGLAASHGTTPVAGYREFYFGIPKPGGTDHPEASGEEDRQIVGVSYDPTAAFSLQFPNGKYEINYLVDIPDDFDKWLYDNTNGVSLEVHSTDSPAVGQDTAGAPLAILEIEMDVLLIQA
jgi:hypothetical protein